MSVLRQALHVFAKDLRRFRAELLVVAALLAVAVVTLDPGAGTSTVLSGMLLPAAVLLVTGMVVQEDGPGDERAFWITRPLEPLALVLGKALFVGVLVVATVAAHVGAVAALPASDPPGRIFLGALVAFGGLVAAAAGVASVTRSLQSFVVAGLGTALALTVAHRMVFSSVPLGHGEGTTATFLLSAGWLALGAAAAAHQYATRRTRRTVSLASAAALGLVVVVPRLGLDLSTSTPAGPEPVEIPAETVAFDIEGLTLQPGDGRWDAEVGDRPALVGSYVLTGDGVLVVEPREVATVARGAGVERSWRGEPRAWTVPSTQRVALPGLVRVDRGGRPDDLPAGPTRGQSALLVAPPDEMRRLAAGVDRLDVTVTFDAYRLVVRGTLPLARGAVLRGPDGRYSLEDAGRSASAVVVTLSHRAVTSALTPGRSTTPDGGVVVLLNRERKEYAVGRPGGGSASDLGPMLAGIRTRGERRRFEFGDPPDTPGQGPSLDDAWLRGAEVAVVEREYVGSFSKSWSSRVEMPRVFDRYVRVPPPEARGRGRSQSSAPRTP